MKPAHREGMVRQAAPYGAFAGMTGGGRRLATSNPGVLWLDDKTYF